MAVCYTVRVRGRVQGVGYRYFVVKEASRYGLSGYTKNLPDGSVEVVAEGEREILDRFLQVLKEGPTGASVRDVELDTTPATGAFSGFEISY